MDEDSLGSPHATAEGLGWNPCSPLDPTFLPGHTLGDMESEHRWLTTTLGGDQHYCWTLNFSLG